MTLFSIHFLYFLSSSQIWIASQASEHHQIRFILLRLFSGYAVHCWQARIHLFIHLWWGSNDAHPLVVWALILTLLWQHRIQRIPYPLIIFKPLFSVLNLFFNLRLPLLLFPLLTILMHFTLIWVILIRVRPNSPRLQYQQRQPRPKNNRPILNKIACQRRSDGLDLKTKFVLL